MRRTVTAVVGSYATDGDALAVLLGGQPSTALVYADDPRFEEIAAVLAWSWRTRREVTVEIDSSRIVSASKGGQR